jgi:hypothetical protein
VDAGRFSATVWVCAIGNQIRIAVSPPRSG